MIFGMLAIWLALGGTLVSMGAYLRWMLAEREGEDGSPKDREKAVAWGERVAPIARWGFAFSLAMLVLAILQIETAAYKHDFTLSYITRFSSRDEPKDYLFATLWAGQEGTFLLWCTYVTLLGVIVRRYAKSYEASVMFFLNLIRLSLLIVLVGKSPFAPTPQMLPTALQTGVSTFHQAIWAFFHPGGLNMAMLPVDGQGLNPLLQNAWMRIHPPTLFLGFACTSLPFAFAMSALWKKDYTSWVRRSLPWTAVAFTVLGTGIMMGGYWAYAVLGWGGFWGWDPVENSSKVPWLMCVLLLHGMLMQVRRNTWHRFNLLLGLLPFLMVMFSSFLTRSGILENFSVHSFGKEDDLFPYLIGPLTFFWILGIGSWLGRWKTFPADEVETKPRSVPALLNWAVGLIAVFAFLVWAGMSSPLLTGLAAGLREKLTFLTFLPKATSNVSQSFYNFMATPLASLAALMMTYMTLLNWRDTDLRKTYKKALLPFALSVVVVFLAVANGVGRDRPPYELHRWGTPGNLYHLVLPAAVPLLSLIFAGAMALSSSLQVVFSTPQKISRLGGYLSHAGIGVLLIGVVTSEVNDKEQQVSLVKGQPQEVMGYQVTYGGMYTPTGNDKPALDLTFTRGKESFKAPTPMYFSNYNKQYMYAPYIHKYPGVDLYIAPEGPPTNTSDMVKRSVEMMPGQQTEMINGVSLRFVKYEMSGEPGQTITVGTAVDVLRDGKAERIVPQWRAEPGKQIATLPAMTADGNVTIEIGDLNQGTRAATLVVGGHALGEPLGPPQEIALIKVSTKPMINLVWLATLLVMCGGLLTVKRSFGDLARAEARDRSDYANEEESGGPGPDGVESEPRVKRRQGKKKEAVAGAHLAEGSANP
jgi:cytochrome c-type biogenesis protein CcmF